MCASKYKIARKTDKKEERNLMFIQTANISNSTFFSFTNTVNDGISARGAYLKKITFTGGAYSAGAVNSAGALIKFCS